MILRARSFINFDAFYKNMVSLSERISTIEPLVVDQNTNKRKYYRFRPAPFYGGIATADCVGCPLTCVFCWSGYPRDHPQRAGKWYTPDQVFHELNRIAKRKGYTQLRVSGNEPTLGKEHLLRLIELVDKTSYQFILETSGILLDEQYAEDLSHFSNVHVRVSLKGTCEEEFQILTGLPSQTFRLQLRGLKELLDHHVSCHPAVMVSFSRQEKIDELKERLFLISPQLYVEEEHVMLYPLVKKRLNQAGLL